MFVAVDINEPVLILPILIQPKVNPKICVFYDKLDRNHMRTAKQTLTEWFDASQITINGNRSYDIQIHDERFYDRVLAEGFLGFGESYMDCFWDCQELDELIYRTLRAGLEEKVASIKNLMPYLRAIFFNRQRRSKAFDIGKHHYDIGNDLYIQMLDSRMAYSCGYWRDAENLEAAQQAKLDLICRKLQLQPHMRVLDIGCGWGSFAGYAAEKYGVQIVGITVSQDQIKLAKERYKHLDIDFRYQDYREVNEPFDRIVSVGMFEHVGPKNYRAFMEVVNRCLSDDGYLLLHTIGSNIDRKTTDPWTEKYIFPRSVPPSAARITRAAEGLFVMRDWHSFGGDYARTLKAWYENFDTHWSTLSANYDDRFYRMWRFFLLTAAGSFRANRNQLWQIVFTKHLSGPDYNSIR